MSIRKRVRYPSPLAALPILVALLLSLSHCAVLCRLCSPSAPGQGVALLDGSGNPTGTLDLFDNLRVGVTGLHPGTRYTLRIVDADERRQLAYSRLTADRRGTIAPLTLLFAENLLPCAPIGTFAAAPAADAPSPAFAASALRRTGDLERVYAGRRYLVEVLEGERVVRRAPFSIQDRQEPRLYVANAQGCLRSGLGRGDDDVYVVGRNFTAGSRVQLFVVTDQRVWKQGDPFQDVSGPDGRPAVEEVQLGPNQRDFFVRVWSREVTSTGLYDVIARPAARDRLAFDVADVVTANYDVGLTLQADAMGPHIEQNMTVPASSGIVYYTLFQDKYFNDEDVWVAVNPKDRPGGTAGPEQTARIYVVDALTESGWTDGTALTDVSSDGYEEVPIKGWCRNQNEVRVWPAPLTDGSYDVIVDFAPFGVYNQGQDIVDELDNPGFQVVAPAAFAIVYPVNPVKIFPEKEVPAGMKKDSLFAVAKIHPAAAGTTIHWDSRDVDDPTSDSAPVDPNAAAGDDNRGNFGAAPGAPDGDDGFLEGEDGSGVSTSVTLAGGFAYATFHATSQPGDNFRIRASTSPTFATFDDSAAITVWRKLHVEIDSMGAPAGTSVSGNIASVTFDAMTNTSQVTVDVVLDIGVGTGGRFENGVLTAGGTDFPVVSNNASVITATGNVPDGMPFTVKDDDDVVADVAPPDTGDMVRAYGRAFILPVFDTGLDTPGVAFDVNTESAEQTGQISLGKGTPTSTADYWTVTIQGGYQDEVNHDNDPDDEGTSRAWALDWVQGTIALTESIRDWIQTPAIKDGAGGVDPDVTGEIPRHPRRQEILDHEVGHLLSLQHGDGSITAADPFGGVMRPSCCPANFRQSSNFTQISLHKLRSIEQPD